MPKSPDFLRKTVETLAKRASQFCSNPDCLNNTSGPHSDKSKAINLGEAAHIRGARRGSKRYDPSMTDEERSDISNGIWLCRGCASKIDKDEEQFTAKLLHIWKEVHENTVDMVNAKRTETYSDAHIREELSRLQKENTELRQELKFLKDFKSQYMLVTAPGGAKVYAPENRDHYVCQGCWDNKGNKEILSDLHVPSGHFECPGCKNRFRVNPSQQLQQTYASGVGNPLNRHSWMGR